MTETLAKHIAERKAGIIWECDDEKEFMQVWKELNLPREVIAEGWNLVIPNYAQALEVHFVKTKDVTVIPTCYEIVKEGGGRANYGTVYKYA